MPAPQPTLSHYQEDSLTHLSVNHCICQFQLEGHQEPCNEVGLWDCFHFFFSNCNGINPCMMVMRRILHSLFQLSFLGSVSILGYSLGKRSCIQQEVNFNEFFVFKTCFIQPKILKGYLRHQSFILCKL